ncbi:hypothetical protein D9611_007520 [Ephemerocybe angulata]|uniref:Geranylgeranyl pyrophosphate synthetase n=1 Tax=Ephemerocybe angulata TaxID=980116 RepID=A0A8H5FKQ2_9AGAR|nr:hypothetical protein D9611_007520 [Tulosesus angulatus]
MATLDSSQAPWRKSTFDPQMSFRGYRGGRGRGRPSSYVPRKDPAAETLPPDRDLYEGLHSTPLKSLQAEVADPADEDIRIEGLEYIGSYSWTACETPTVIVPGAPRQWLNRTAPYNVQPDIGLFFVDQNGYRMSRAPLVPLVASVNKRTETNPDFDFDWASVDVVTDRNALRKLMRWVRNEEGMRDFRMDLELAGEKTVLVNRWEARTREMYNGRTYGYNFEKSSTEPAPGCQKGSGHHRIVTYDLNGLKMVVRFEVDACLPPTRSRKSIDAAVDDVSDLLAAVNLTSNTSSTSQSHYSLNIVPGGYEAKSPTIMELTTRFEGRVNDFDWADKYMQLFFSQTPHHVLAVHNRGRFSALQRRKLSDPEFQELEKRMQPDLKALRKALALIQSLVIEHGQRGRLTLVCKGGVLSVYERTSQESCLPDHMMALFD